MSLTPAVKPHDWHFVAAEAASGVEGGGVPVVIAVCRRCELIRAAVAAAQRENKISLSGSCEG